MFRRTYDAVQLLVQDYRGEQGDTAETVWSSTEPVFEYTCEPSALRGSYIVGYDEDPNPVPTPPTTWHSMDRPGAITGYDPPEPLRAIVANCPTRALCQPSAQVVNSPSSPGSFGCTSFNEETVNPWVDEPSVCGELSFSGGDSGSVNTLDALRASACPPSQRVHLFTAAKPASDVAAMRSVVHALGLSCMAAKNSVDLPENSPPPPIQEHCRHRATGDLASACRARMQQGRRPTLPD